MIQNIAWSQTRRENCEYAHESSKRFPLEADIQRIFRRNVERKQAKTLSVVNCWKKWNLFKIIKRDIKFSKLLKKFVDRWSSQDFYFLINLCWLFFLSLKYLVLSPDEMNLRSSFHRNETLQRNCPLGTHNTTSCFLNYFTLNKCHWKYQIAESHACRQRKYHDMQLPICLIHVSSCGK